MRRESLTNTIYRACLFFGVLLSATLSVSPVRPASAHIEASAYVSNPVGMTLNEFGSVATESDPTAGTYSVRSPVGSSLCLQVSRRGETVDQFLLTSKPVTDLPGQSSACVATGRALLDSAALTRHLQSQAGDIVVTVIYTEN